MGTRKTESVFQTLFGGFIGTNGKDLNLKLKKCIKELTQQFYQHGLM